MANIENLKQSIRYETIGNATGKSKNTVKCYFNINKLDIRNPEHVSEYVKKIILNNNK